MNVKPTVEVAREFMWRNNLKDGIIVWTEDLLEASNEGGTDSCSREWHHVERGLQIEIMFWHCDSVRKELKLCARKVVFIGRAYALLLIVNTTKNAVWWKLLKLQAVEDSL